MAPRTSPIWEYYIDDPDNPTNAVCIVPGCKKTKVSRGPDGSNKANLAVTPLVTHLKNSHPQKHKDYLLSKNNLEETKKRKAEEADDDDEMEHKSLADKKMKNQTQSTLNSWAGGSFKASQGPSCGNLYPMKDPRAMDRHRGVLSMMILDLQPVSIVDDPGFKIFSTSMDKHFKVGSRHFYSDKIVKVYDVSRAKVEEKLEKDAPLAVSAQLDGWSVNHHGYVGLLVNYITAGWKRVSLNIACSPMDERHTGENLGMFLEEKLDSWKALDKCNVIVSDSASNMIKLMEFMPPRMSHVSCLNHVLNLVIKDEILKKPEIENICKYSRTLVGFANSSNNFYEEMRTVSNDLGQKELVLKQDVRTRWNSTDEMLERLVTMELVLKKVVDEKGWGETIFNKEKGGKKKLTDKDWKVVKNVVKVLDPFKDATVKLSSSSACISESIPTVSCLLKTLERRNNDSDEGVIDLKKRLTDNLSRRTDHMEDDEIYTIATLLDHRFKNNYFRSEEKMNKAMDKLKLLLATEMSKLPVQEEDVTSELGNNEDNNNAHSLASMFAKVKKNVNNNPRRVEDATVEKVLDEYFNDKLEDNNLNMWRKYEEGAKDNRVKKALCNLARVWLTPPPTSTQTERLFSVAGNIVDGRPRLLPETLEKLLFLRENLIMQNIGLNW